MIELTTGGKNAIQLPDGEISGCLEDGDAVELRAWCEKPVRPASASVNALDHVLPARRLS